MKETGGHIVTKKWADLLPITHSIVEFGQLWQDIFNIAMVERKMYTGYKTITREQLEYLR